MKVVVSGIGLITPLGASRELTWRRLLDGSSAIVQEPHGLEASLKNFSVNGTRSRMGDFAVAAAKEALIHAGIDDEFIATNRIGCAVSQSKPILTSHETIPDQNLVPFPFRGRARVGDKNRSVSDSTPSPSSKRGGELKSELDSALILSSFFGWSCETVVKRELNLIGPSANIAAACATGVASIETGRHWIESGACDVALVGASESSLHPFFRAGFEQMGVLAKGSTAKVACPFDRKRSGFVMGEGAAVLVLESESSAARRGHKPLASLLSVKMRHSSCDILRFDPDGTAISSLIENVTENQPRPDYINAHGTGTVFNDAVECKGIRLALGSQANHVAISSTKAATGHLLGAAGAVEAAFAVLALHEAVLPPTLHFSEPDSYCDFDFVPNVARKQKIESAMSLSYGFGGQMGGVLFGLC